MPVSKRFVNTCTSIMLKKTRANIFLHKNIASFQDILFVWFFWLNGEVVCFRYLSIFTWILNKLHSIKTDPKNMGNERLQSSLWQGSTLMKMMLTMLYENQIVKYLYQNIILHDMTQYRIISWYRKICTT